MKRTVIAVVSVLAVMAASARVGLADVGALSQAGADRLVDLQNDDGGWDWPLDDGTSTNASPKNTIGPIGMGLAFAYTFTGDANHLASLQQVATFLQAKTNNFSPSDGYLAKKLDDVLGGTANVDHVTTNFYDPLASGTYDRNGAGTLYSTASYVQRIRDGRASHGNLAEWDIGMGVVGAAAAGADTADWVAGVKAEVNEHDSSDYYDVIGLAGAVFALSVAHESFDPTAGDLASAGSVGDLADTLASYQILSSGGFAWNANFVIPDDGNEAVQETAYAMLALYSTGDRTYWDEIAAACDYLEAVQLSTGGFKNYPGSIISGENNEITGEALWAAGETVACPEPATMSLVALGGLSVLWKRRRKA